MWKSPTGTASGSPRTGPSTLWTVHGPTPGIVPRRAPASTGSSATRRSSPRARRAQRITVSARFRSTPSGWNHHEGCCASTSGSGGSSRPAGPGAGSESRRQSSHHARAASIDVTRCASTVGTIWWSRVSQRPIRNPGAAARARATTSSGTGRSNGASPAPTSAGTRSSSQSAPGPQAARRSRSPSHHSRKVPGPSGVRVRPPDLGRGDPRGGVPPAVLERSERVPEVQRAGSREHAGDRTRHPTRQPGTPGRRRPEGVWRGHVSPVRPGRARTLLGRVEPGPPRGRLARVRLTSATRPRQTPDRRRRAMPVAGSAPRACHGWRAGDAVPGWVGACRLRRLARVRLIDATGPRQKPERRRSAGSGRPLAPTGLDLGGYGEAPDAQAQGSVQAGFAVQRHIASLIPHLRSLPQPVIAAVNGPATGGGFALVLGFGHPHRRDARPASTPPSCASACRPATSARAGSCPG